MLRFNLAPVGEPPEEVERTEPEKQGPELENRSGGRRVLRDGRSDGVNDGKGAR
jgi:hypothetical protein